MTPKDDELLADLLIRWEELREQDQDVSAVELCQDCPYLADELSRRINGLKATLWLNKPLGSVLPRQVQHLQPCRNLGHSPAGIVLIT